jgi:hypothetical protein
VRVDPRQRVEVLLIPALLIEEPTGLVVVEQLSDKLIVEPQLGVRVSVELVGGGELLELTRDAGDPVEQERRRMDVDRMARPAELALLGRLAAGAADPPGENVVGLEAACERRAREATSEVEDDFARVGLVAPAVAVAAGDLLEVEVAEQKVDEVAAGAARGRRGSGRCS